MGKTSAEKFLGFVKRGSLHRVKSYLRRGKVDVNEVLNQKQRTALHVACFLGEDIIARALLRYGADPQLVDEDGNTAVLLALKYSLDVRSRTVYEDLVKPLLRVSEAVLDVENKDGETAREVLHNLKAVLREYDQERQREEKAQESLLEERRAGHNEEEWREKLFFEMGEDLRYDEPWVEENEHENYDQWADRIREEFNHKRRDKRQDDTRRKMRKERDDKAKEDTERLQKEHEAYQEMVSKKRLEKRNEKNKKLYDTRCEEMFEPACEQALSYDSMPWPCPGAPEDMVKMLITWSELSDGRKYLKEQQVRWHPDRFLQRCGSRLLDSDRDRVMDTVKKISQELNSYLQENSK